LAKLVIPPLGEFDDSMVLQRFRSAAAKALTSIDMVLDLIPSPEAVTGDEKSLLYNQKMKV